MPDIKAAIQKAINDGLITQEQVDALIAKKRQEITIKPDLDNLGEALVSVMMTQADHEERIAALEAAAGGGGGA
jgi:hypothetical protein